MTPTRFCWSLGLLTATMACGPHPKPYTTYTITASGSHVIITPGGLMNVKAGSTQAFSLLAEENYALSSAVGGTCPSGNWMGNVYTTGPIESDCTLSFSAMLESFTVTPSGTHVMINPSLPQLVDGGGTAAFTVTADTGYTTAQAAGGTCAAGSWTGAVYTTGPVSMNCTVTFSAGIDTFQVSASGDGNETITPSGSQSVSYGATQSFTVVASTGYSTSAAVGGTCAAGSWSENVYTTGPVTGDCTVVFGATLLQFQVTAMGDSWETFTPTTAQTVSYGQTQSFTVAPDTGYMLGAVAGTCPSGSWSGSVYTTGPIVATCTVAFAATLETFQVSSSGDGWETISPSSPQAVAYGQQQTFTVTASTGYTLSQSVGGDCPAGTWSGSGYTTGPITASCSVSFTATASTYEVTPLGDSNETITPSDPQTVGYGQTQSFTVTPNSGYSLDLGVRGGCPVGIWDGYVYTTGAITADCTVTFSATQVTYQVTGSGDSNETISPSNPQTVTWGQMLSFTVTPSPGYTLLSSVGGTCPAGSWSGSVYTTGAIVRDCSAAFSASLSPALVSVSGDSNETITPDMPETVAIGSTLTYTVTANTGYTVSQAVGGTCPTGSWNGATYTTGTIASDCSVAFTATLNLYTVTPSGDGWETIAPSTPQTVSYGETQSFTVTPSVGYTVLTSVQGTCPAGTWNGDAYTTGVISADCSVIFGASQNIYSVTSSGDSHEMIQPAGTQLIGAGTSARFTVTSDAGYTATQQVGGSCPTGSWSGSVYTTAPIYSDCSVSFSATLNIYQVTPGGDGNEVFTPDTPQSVSYGGTQTFTVTADRGYALSMTATGTCPAGSWNGGAYTTGVITGDCSVSFTATPITFRVSATSSDGWETVSPTGPQIVLQGATQTFTVTPAAGYTVSTAVTGTCPAGSWSADVYTTGPIVADCSVSFSATAATYTVTVSGDGWETISPTAAQTVGYGSTQSYTVDPLTGYRVSTTVGGTCPAGSWTGDEWTTGPITVDCTVVFSAPRITYQVSPSGDGWETINPSGAQAIPYDTPATFTVDPLVGWAVSATVTGTCPPGSWSADVYTTGPIPGPCTVLFSAALESYQVTVSGDGNETINPSAPQTLAYCETATVTVTPDSGEAISWLPGGTCAAGSWSGSDYTTGSVTGDCSVEITSLTPFLQAQSWSTMTSSSAGILYPQVVTGATDSEQFAYSDSSAEVHSDQTFTFQATSAADRTITFAFDYKGFHAYYLATAGLTAFADGPDGTTTVVIVPESTTNGNFEFRGTAMLNVSAGYAFGFVADGSNEDSTETLHGTITLSTISD
jgi:hypothetical protein